MALHPSIRIEGGLLGPDIQEQLLAGDLPGQRAADFGLGARRNLTDEIAAVFADARALWGVFQHRLDRLPNDDVATSITRDAWMIPFLGLLGYEPRYNQRAYEEDGLTFAISHRAGEAEDSPPIHIVGIRQELGRVAASGRPRLAPHSLVQEYLNRTDRLWGIVTNGAMLRLLRDSTFVRRQAYVEFDLPAILDEQQFEEFAVLYRLLHRTRLPKGADDTDECLLEKYYQHSVEQGGRVRDRLRDGVEECLKILANGFLSHSANDELRRRIAPDNTSNDRITADGFYRQLLILVYRFLFLLVSEDRGLLSADPLYRDHYSIGRLRRRLEHRAAFDHYDDLWQSLRVLWLVLTNDRPQPALDNRPLASALGLQVLNGELFAPLALDGFTLTNNDLLSAIWHLARYRESPSSPPRRVNYAALDVEELGSVYESLLEFHPTIDPDAAGRPVFRFVTGSERKTTGSYYTPPTLVGELIKSALEPVIADRLQGCTTPEEKARALLSIRVCDPACGSGHFLLAAARRLGKELASVRTGEDEPAPERVREAVRDVVSHSIYGVDKNPLAVDLCRVALWLESHTADKPLTFLDHRIRCGDSLVGVFDLEVLREGIPDEAFKPLTGDDKETARRLKAANRAERRDLERGQRTLPLDPADVLDDWTQLNRELDAIADDSPEAIRRKKELFEQSHRDATWRRRKQACDLWTAAFFQRFASRSSSATGAGDEAAITTAVLAEHLAGRPVEPRALGRAEALAVANRFFHWPLEFPEVFADGGFDVVFGNPPWERVKLQEKEFFATRNAQIASAPNAAARGRLIRELAESNPALLAEFRDAVRAAEGASVFLRAGGRFPLCGRGDINTYTVFAELMRSLTGARGRVGCIVPSGIATDDTTKFFFQELIESRSLDSLLDFENRKKIFAAVHSRYKFCLLTLRGANSEWRMANGSKALSKRESDRTSDQPPFTTHHSPGGGAAQFAFFLHDPAELKDPDRVFSLAPDDIRLLNPNTRTCPIFRSRADAELTKAIYRRVPVLLKEARDGQPEENPWGIKFLRMFDMSNDSHLFRTREQLEAEGFTLEGNIFRKKLPLSSGEGRGEGMVEEYLPLYEAKFIHQFEHRHATLRDGVTISANQAIELQLDELGNPQYFVLPRYWVARTAVVHTLENFTAKQWLVGFRDVTRATDYRTCTFAIIPLVAVGHTMPIVVTEDAFTTSAACFLAGINSYVQDYQSRQKPSGIHLTFFIVAQLAILSPDAFERGFLVPTLESARHLPLTIRDWLVPRVLELTYTAWDLEPFARDVLAELQSPPGDGEQGLAGYWKRYSPHSPAAIQHSPPPFRWDDERRFWLRAELDAAFFHLYLPAEANGQWRMARRHDGAVVDETPEQLAELTTHFPTPRDAVEYIMETFPIVKRKDIDRHGTYRTKEAILEIYDAMAEAQRTGRPYQTRLDPPPADVRVAHPPREATR